MLVALLLILRCWKLTAGVCDCFPFDENKGEDEVEVEVDVDVKVKDTPMK